MTTTTIAIIGGTGDLGAAIARRLAKAGHPVIIGSRSSETAQARAEELGFEIRGLSNAEAAQQGDIVFVTVPFAAQEATLTQIKPHVAGKIVVETTVPLVPPKVARVQLPAEGSAAQRAQKLLGDEVTLVSGFHNVAAAKLASDEDVECDVLVVGDSKDARGKIVDLVSDMGLRGIHAGSLANAAAVEAMTSLLIFINKTYSVPGAGIRITGDLSGTA